jgi:hypothetical protein
MPDSESWVAYECTPTNTITFACTGGDGVHFGLLLRDNTPGPVVMTVPMNFDNANVIVGGDLREFLSLGCCTGFFGLEQLTYDRRDAIEWIAAAESPEVDGADELLRRLRASLALRPWASIERRLSELDVDFAASTRLTRRSN